MYFRFQMVELLNFLIIAMANLKFQDGGIENLSTIKPLKNSYLSQIDLNNLKQRKEKIMTDKEKELVKGASLPQRRTFYKLLELL